METGPFLFSLQMSRTPGNLSFVVRLKSISGTDSLNQCIWSIYFIPGTTRSNILFDKMQPFVTGVCKSHVFSGYQM